MKKTINSKIILVTLAVMFVFGVIAIMPESASASYGYNDYGGNYYGSDSYYGGTYIQGLAGSESPWYPSIVVPIESQTFYMEQTWRRYGLDSSEFKSNYSNSNSGFNYNSHYTSSNHGSRGSYGY
jgi:hypothetical protein